MLTVQLMRCVLALAATVPMSSWRLSSVRYRHAAAPPATVIATAPMSIARMAHTASTLSDGRVLVAGGFTSEENAALSAELYDAATGRFTPLPRMIAVRHSHTATVLPGGRVLLVGGYGVGNAVLSSAEVFDPMNQTFTPTGSMLAPRGGHVAVLLGNGKVLIAGGVGAGWSFLSSAELYDPATGRFSPTSAMTVARESHIAVRLQDGRVLIAGGHRGRRAEITLYASAETYDPSTQRFTPVGDMRVRRHKHDAVLLRDGRVLITGGSDERDSKGVYTSTELFNPTSDTFVIGPVMLVGRYKHNGSTVLLANGTVLLAGGAPQAETYDPTSRTFTMVAGDARMAGQFSATAPLSGGRVLITGGYGNGSDPRASAWLFRP